MNAQLLEWGLFSFMIGMVLSLPLAAVYYQKQTSVRALIIVPRKLKSAHLDYFMQAFALGFAYLIEFCLKMEIPLYVIIPLVYGSILNPTILLLEATPLFRSGLGRILYVFLRGTSPAALMFAWFAITFLFMPLYLWIMLLSVILIGITIFLTFKMKLSSIKKTLNNS